MNTRTKYDRMKHFLAAQKQPDYRFKQVIHAIFKQRIGDFDQMTTLPKTVRRSLVQAYGENILHLHPVLEQTSRQVKKVLFEISGQNRVEAVAMKYRKGWESFCISSQCGCGFNCRFCATGAIGLKRNLTADEITDQVLYFHLQHHSLDSIAFMGMGEALANPHLFDALHMLTDPDLFGLSPRRLTVSTIGIIPNMRKLSDHFPNVNLTFSLHSPFNEQRSELMPINETYPLEEVLTVLDEHIKKTRRKVYIAYVMLRGVNDSRAHAEAVTKLLKGRGPWDHLYHVNVIRYHPAVGAPRQYAQSDERQIKMFYDVLQAAGVRVTVRQSFGVDIDAACGQLYGEYRTRGQPSI